MPPRPPSRPPLLRNDRPPVRWRHALERVLLPRRLIAQRVRALASQIQHDHAHQELVVLPLLSGTVFFVADLLRHLDLPVRLDFLGVSSYRDATHPGAMLITKDLRLDVRNRHVLLVDDILDTGRTLHWAIERLRPLRPRRISVCVLLQKDVPRAVRIRPRYVGFRIPNAFVVGYGLDYAEHYRNLPFIAVLRPLPT